jgi:hypothetical protein
MCACSAAAEVQCLGVGGMVIAIMDEIEGGECFWIELQSDR